MEVIRALTMEERLILRKSRRRNISFSKIERRRCKRGFGIEEVEDWAGPFYMVTILLTFKLGLIIIAHFKYN